MDTIDREILRLLQADNRRSSNDIGKEIGLSVSAVNERVRRLNSSGVVEANRAIIPPAAVGYDLCTFIFVDIDVRGDEAAFVAGAVASPEVQELHHITGSHSYLLKVRTRSTIELQLLLSTRLKQLPGVLRTESFVVLATHKETTELPLDGAGEPARGG
jgi:Lrp/AsnC family leucine-responsive transcriptional regulator